MTSGSHHGHHQHHPWRPNHRPQHPRRYPSRRCWQLHDWRMRWKARRVGGGDGRWWPRRKTQGPAAGFNNLLDITCRLCRRPRGCAPLETPDAAGWRTWAGVHLGTVCRWARYAAGDGSCSSGASCTWRHGACRTPFLGFPKGRQPLGLRGHNEVMSSRLRRRLQFSGTVLIYSVGT